MEAGKLTIRDDDGEAIPLIAIGPDTFMSHSGRTIHFARDAEGNVNSLLQGGNAYQRHR